MIKSLYFDNTAYQYAYAVQLLADNLGACLSTTGEGSMTVEEGTKTVAVSLDTQADTTVAITNQEASEDWDWFQA